MFDNEEFGLLRQQLSAQLGQQQVSFQGGGGGPDLFDYVSGAARSFLAGFTGLSSLAPEPENQAQAITNELFSLAGLLGLVFPIGFAGRGALTAGGLAARAITKVGITGKAAQSVGAFRSLPLTGAHVISEGLARAFPRVLPAIEATGKAGQVGAQIFREGGQAALTMMLASPWTDGFGTIVQQGLVGLFAGSLGAGIANAPAFREMTSQGKLLRMVAGGSGDIALGAALFNETDPAHIVKNAILGGVFAGFDRPAEVAKADDLLMRMAERDGTIIGAKYVEFSPDFKDNFRSLNGGIAVPDNVLEAIPGRARELFQPQEASRAFAFLTEYFGAQQEALRTLQERVDEAEKVELLVPDVMDQSPAPSVPPGLIGRAEALAHTYPMEDFDLAIQPLVEPVESFLDHVIPGESEQVRSATRDMVLQHLDPSRGELPDWREFSGTMREAYERINTDESRPWDPTWMDDLVVYYHRRKQAVPRNLGAFNFAEGRYVPYQGTDLEGNRIEMHGPPTVLDELGGDVRVIREAELEGGPAGLTDVEMTPQRWGTLLSSMYEDGYYLYSGNADKGEIHFARLNIPGSNFEIRAEVLRIVAVLGNSDYVRGRERFQRLTGLGATEAGRRYNEILVSNVRYWEQLNGRKLVRMLDGDFLGNVVDFNKRLQPLNTNFYKVPREFFVDENGNDVPLTYMIIPDDDASDGGMLVRPDIMGRLQESMGLPREGGQVKPFLISNGGNQTTANPGLLIGKLGAQNVSDELAAQMQQQGVAFLIRESAAKQMGMRQSVPVRWEDGVLKIDESIEDPSQHIYRLDPEDIRLSDGVYDNSINELRSSKRLVLQLMLHQNLDQMSPEGMEAMQRITLQASRGNSRDNEVLDRYLDDPTAENLDRLMEVIDHVRLSVTGGKMGLIEAIQTPRYRELANRLTAKVMRSSVEGLEDDHINVFDSTYDVQAAEQRLGAGLKWLRNVRSPEARLMKVGRPLHQKALMNWFIKQVAKPKWRGSGKAFMREIDPQLRSKLGEIRDDEFYLDDNWKGLETRFGGERQTLGELWAELQSKKVPETTKDAIRDYLQTTLARVPMDDISGAQVLRFAGFTGIRGGGVVLSKLNMSRLGGADFDGDTAFFYFGLPKALRDDLVRNSNNQERAEAIRPMEERLKEFQADPGDVDPGYQSSLFHMFDPYHRVQVAQTVSQGRGKMAGIAVNARFFVQSMLDIARAGIKETGGNVYEDSHGVRFVPRGDGGEEFRAMASAAIQMSVDVAKFGGMVDEYTLRAKLLQSAFEKIVVRRDIKLPDGTTRVEWENIANNMSALRRFFGFDPGNPEAFGRYAGRSAWQTAAGQANRTRARLFGYNFAEGRGWRPTEMQTAADLLPRGFEHPLRAVAGEVSRLDYHQSITRHALDDLETYRENIERLNDAMRRNPQLAELLGVKLNDEGDLIPLTVPTASAIRRLKVLKKWFWRTADQRTGLRTERGIKHVASDTDMWGDFFRDFWSNASNGRRWSFLAETNPKRYAALRRLGIDDAAEAFQHYRDNIVGIEKMPGLEAWAQYSLRDRFIRKRIRETEDFLSNDLDDFRSVRHLLFAFERSGLTPRDFQALYTEVQKIKLATLRDTSLDEWRQARAQIDGEVNIKKTNLNVAEQKVNRLRNDLMRQMNDRGLDGQAGLDLIDAMLFSTIRTIEPVDFTHYRKAGGEDAFKTVSNRVGLELSSNKGVRIAGRLFAETLQAATGPKLSSKEVDALFMQSPAVIGARRHRHVARSVKGIFRPHEGSLDDIEDPKIRVMAQEAADLISHYPALADDPKALTAFIRSFTGKAEIKDMTIQDFTGFVEHLRRLRHGYGFFNWWKKHVKKDGNRIWWSYAILFPETTADMHRSDDLRLIHKAAGDFEAPNLRTINNEGQLERVYGDAAVAISSFHRTILHMQNAENAYTSQYEQDLRRHVSASEWIRLGIPDEEGTNRVADLWKIAMAEWELEGGRRYAATLQRGTLEFDRAWADVHKFERRLEELEELRSDLLGRRYDVSQERRERVLEEGRRVTERITEELDGRAVINRIKDYFSESAQRYYRERVEVNEGWIKRWVKQTAGDIDIAETFKPFQRLLEHGRIGGEHITHDAARFLQYENEVEVEARRRINEGEVEVPTESNVRNLYMDPGVQQAMERFPKLEALRGKSKDEIIRLLNIEWARSQGDQKYRDALGQVYQYVRGRRMNEGDIRRLWMGQENYSQYDFDLRIAQERAVLEGEAWRRAFLRYTKHRVREERTFLRTGFKDGYWPHMDFDEKVLHQSVLNEADRLLQEGATDEQLDGLKAAEAKALRTMEHPDGFRNQATAEDIVSPRPNRVISELSVDRRASSAMARDFNFDGYSYDIVVWERYMQQISKATFQTLSSTLAHNAIRDFERRAPLGEENSKAWGLWQRLYVRDALGYPSTFPSDIISNPVMKLKRTPYYWLSDHWMFMNGTPLNKAYVKITGKHKMTPLEQRIAEERLGRPMNEGEKRSFEDRKFRSLTDREIDGTINEAGMAEMADRYRALQSVEGKYELATLLFRAKSAFLNILGGNHNTLIWTGGRYMWMASGYFQGVKHFQRLRNAPENWRTMEDVNQYFAEQGLVEEWILYEAGLTGAFSEGKYRAFLEDALDLFKTNWKASNKELFALARRHGISDAFMNTAAFFMRRSERTVRLRAAKAAYLQAYDQFEGLLSYDNPHLLDQARKAVNATQFLYHAAARPAFARTSLGKIWNRFRMWTWSSVRFRRQVFQAAKDMGFAPETPDFKRFQRMMQADLLVVALATAIPYSLFDMSMPPPYQWVQETADWLFGNDDERDRAFFGRYSTLSVLPDDARRAIAPLNEFVPPVLRGAKGLNDLFLNLMTGETENTAWYTWLSLVPFGLMGRDVARTIEAPAMAPKFLLNLPLYEIDRYQREIAE